MTIRFECPHCDKKLKLKDEYAGRKARCPNCSEKIVVPELEDSEPEIDDAPPPPAPTVQAESDDIPSDSGEDSGGPEDGGDSGDSGDGEGDQDADGGGDDDGKKKKRPRPKKGPKKREAKPVQKPNVNISKEDQDRMAEQKSKRRKEAAPPPPPKPQSLPERGMTFLIAAAAAGVVGLFLMPWVTVTYHDEVGYETKKEIGFTYHQTGLQAALGEYTFSGEQGMTEAQVEEAMDANTKKLLVTPEASYGAFVLPISAVILGLLSLVKIVRSTAIRYYPFLAAFFGFELLVASIVYITFGVGAMAQVRTKIQEIKIDAQGASESVTGAQKRLLAKKIDEVYKTDQQTGLFGSAGASGIITVIGALMSMMLVGAAKKEKRAADVKLAVARGASSRRRAASSEAPPPRSTRRAKAVTESPPPKSSRRAPAPAPSQKPSKRVQAPPTSSGGGSPSSRKRAAPSSRRRKKR